MKALITSFEIHASFLQIRKISFLGYYVLISYIDKNGLCYDKNMARLKSSGQAGVTSKSINTKSARNSGFSMNINVQENGVLIVSNSYQVREVTQKDLFTRERASFNYYEVLLV